MSRYVLIETMISMAINAAISAGFALLIFGRRAEVDLWGLGGLALDFVPQTFMIAMMSVLVPTALTRRRVGTGALMRVGSPNSHLPRNLLIRALVAASVSTVLLGGLAIAVLAAIWSGPISFAAVLPLKILYGAAVALLVTPAALRMALSDHE
jgi:hypothetical protein